MDRALDAAAKAGGDVFKRVENQSANWEVTKKYA